MMEDNFIDYVCYDGYFNDMEWGSWKEVVFWIIVFLVNVGFIMYVVWRLVVKYMDVIGSFILVFMKVDDFLG